MPARSSGPAALRRLLPTRSPAFRAVERTLEKLLDVDVNVLVTGESGSGKDYVAESLHSCGNRAARPFVRIDCASIPPDLFESELFGFERGTFTDATSSRAGKLEAARGGTLYLDEITSIAPALQAKLLRVIEQRLFTRLGGSRPIKLDARIVASATDTKVARAGSHAVRNDLLYRLSVVTIELPPLRDRAEDIPALARRFARESAARHRRPRRALSAEALELLCAYPWPGNVRELALAIDRAVVVEDGEEISPAALPRETFFRGEALIQTAVRGEWTIAELERRYALAVLEAGGGNVSRAAKILGISRKTLIEKRRRWAREGRPK
ncbi:MAG: sigma-54 dependent transcriptional regulator [Thermoanaerobaculia bacterium]|nr:sigma-54 dependent transcriptional regulator [Thermoanaerobaculia bacterium]